jgi:adenosylcobinamide-GDP ribazoletransferase
VSTGRAELASRAGRAGALAATFLTILPLRFTRPAGDLGAAAPWFPVIGAAIGALAGGVLLAAESVFGAQIAATLAVLVLIGVTGALHADGLADCADGVGARGGGHERRLAVMRDPATGVFGLLALLAYVLLLVGALTRLGGGADGLRALVVAAAIGRWGALAHAVSAPPARPDGLGAGFVVAPVAVALSALVPVVLALVLVPPLHGLATLLAGALAALATSLWARRMLGGRTGDTLGAAVALGEVVALLALVATAGG